MGKGKKKQEFPGVRREKPQDERITTQSQFVAGHRPPLVSLLFSSYFSLAVFPTKFFVRMGLECRDF
jgi:hypothetical protein